MLILCTCALCILQLCTNLFNFFEPECFAAFSPALFLSLCSLFPSCLLPELPPFPKISGLPELPPFPEISGNAFFSSKIHSYLNETLLHAIWYTALVYRRIQAVSTCIQIRISRPSLVGRSDGLVTRLIPAHGPAGCRRGHCRIKMVDNTDNQKKVGNAENSTALCSTRYT